MTGGVSVSDGGFTVRRPPPSVPSTQTTDTRFRFDAAGWVTTSINSDIGVLRDTTRWIPPSLHTIGFHPTPPASRTPYPLPPPKSVADPRHPPPDPPGCRVQRTSGLDSFTAESVVRKLRDLAASGPRGGGGRYQSTHLLLSSSPSIKTPTGLQMTLYE